MGSRHQGKHLPLEVGVAIYGSQGGIPNNSKARLELKYMGIWESLTSFPLVGCVSSVFSLLTHTQNTMVGDTPTKSCISTSGAKGQIHCGLT